MKRFSAKQVWSYLSPTHYIHFIEEIIHENSSNGCKNCFSKMGPRGRDYMDQPKGFVEPGQESKVCKLIKSLYDLKQAPKQWHEKFDSCMIENGYKSNNVINVFILNHEIIYMLLLASIWMIC